MPRKSTTAPSPRHEIHELQKDAPPTTAGREKLRQQFREGKLDDRTVEIDVRDRNQPSFEIISTRTAPKRWT